MTKQVVAAMLFVAVSASARATEAQYFGTWRLNPAKSDFGPLTIAFAHDGDAWTATQDGRSHTFKMDGKPHPADAGTTEVWKQVDSNTWEVTTALNGKTVVVDRYKLSTDGKTLTDTAESAPGAESAVLRREGQGTGLVGTWKGTVKQDPFTVTVQPYENDGLIYSVVGAFEVKAHFDGKPYPMTGPLMASGSTAAFKKTGPRSFESKQVQPGQPVVTVTVSASPDGKSLTAVGVYGSVKHVWALDRER